MTTLFIYASTESDDAVTNESFDFTFGLEPLFTGSDKILVRARLGYIKNDKTAELVVVVGFRSSIKGPDITNVLEVSPFLPCDIFGLVPGVAIVAANRSKGVVASALARDEVVQLLMVLRGESSQRESVGEVLDNLIIRLTRMWEDWSKVLFRVIQQDPILKAIGVDVREFLAVESGYQHMSWYTTYSTDEKSLIMHRIITAAKAFLSSVLRLQQLDDPLVKSLLSWFDSIASTRILASSTESNLDFVAH